MKYTQILTISSVIAATTYEINISEAVKKGVIRHFDHITDLPTTPFYRTPQLGETYLSFQQKQYANSLLCNQSFDDVVYNVADPYVEGVSNPWPRIVSDLKWPQVEGVLLQNKYPQYIAIHGGVRQFCVLRRYFAKTLDGAPDEPRDREWGPYRCTLHLADGSYKKFITTRSGPERKYKPIVNLVDIRAQADYFGPMHQQFALDSDTIAPAGKWQNNRPITNYTRNEILEKYNVIKFYNAEHELFNDNSRVRVLAKQMIILGDASRVGTMQQVDTMSPSYTLISGGPYNTSVMTADVDTSWERRNLVPNYITRSHKSGFMRTGNILADSDKDVIYTMDYPGYSRYCCTNSAAGYEGYNPEDGRKKGVAYMFQPSYAPFFLAMDSSTCDTASGNSCTETYKPWYDFTADGIDRIAEFIQIKNNNTKEGVFFDTANDPVRENLASVGPKDVEADLFAFLYTGNQKKLIQSKSHENIFGKKYFNYAMDFTHYDPITDNDYWELDAYMFDNCKSVVGEMEVKINYECSNNQYLRNQQEKTDATSYMSPFPDYQDAWQKDPYKNHVGKQLTGFMSDTFEMDKYYNDFENFAPRSQSIDCNLEIAGDNAAIPNSQKQCAFAVIQADSVEQSYAYNQYFSLDQKKHTIKDIHMTDCMNIIIDVEADCGQGSDASGAINAIAVDLANNVQETNYWEYQPRCAANAWDEIYEVMFTPKLADTKATNETTWDSYLRDELTTA